MRLLVVGGGGREHALADKLRRDAPGAEIFCAPGNPGIAELAEPVAIPADDIRGLASFAADRLIDLTVVGPEVPVAEGFSVLFEAGGLALFGPSAAAARLESSKAFAKALMRDCGGPTAELRTFTDADAAKRHLAETGAPIVVKASGLAAGKGAIVCQSLSDATDAIDSMLVESRFGAAGAEVVIEEFMEGVELSTFFLTDGEHAIPLLASRDYKRAGEGDAGPNTGGMGAYAPAGVPDVEGSIDELIDEVRRSIALPVLEGLSEMGCPYRGFLYAGLMITAAGPRVVEFNCRMGDPETQVVLPLTRSDLVEPMRTVAEGGSLAGWRAESEPGAALTTVMTAAGYPGPYEKGATIHLPSGLDPDQLRVYQAGTAMADGELVTAGGRVLAVTGLGADLEEAGARSRAAAEAIAFDGARWRRDIGWHERSDLAADVPAD